MSRSPGATDDQCCSGGGGRRPHPPEHAGGRHAHAPERALVAVSTRRRSFPRHSTGPNRSCPCGPARWSAGPTTTAATGQPRSLPRATWPPARSWATATTSSARPSSASSSTPLMPPSLRTSMSTSSWTTTDPQDRPHPTPATPTPRHHVNFTPTLASWLNLADRFFAELTNKQLRRGALRITAELEGAKPRYLQVWKADPRPLTLTKSADEILNSIAGFVQPDYDSGHQGSLDNLSAC